MLTAAGIIIPEIKLEHIKREVKKLDTDNNIEFLCEPIKTTFILDCTKGYEDGKDVLYFSVTGNPSTFVVYDVNEKKTIRSMIHESNPPGKCIWSQVKDNDGNIYTASAGEPAQLFRYNPEKKSLKKMAALGSNVAAYHLSCDENNNIYMGTAMGGELYCYNAKEDKLINYGTAIEGEKYAISSVYYKNALYCGSRSDDPKFYRFDLKTKAVKIIEFPDAVRGKANAVYYMTIIENYIFPIMKMDNGQYLMLCFNADTEKWENVCETSLGGQHNTELLDRVTYFVNEEGYIKGINIDTLEVIETGILYYALKKGDDGFDYANGFMNGGFYKLEDQEKYPGYTYITSNYDNNSLAYVNIASKRVEFVNGGSILSNPIQIKAVSDTTCGNIVCGGYMSTKGVVYDVETDEYAEFYCRQTEGMTKVGDKTYCGVYTRAAIWELDEAKPFVKEENPKPIFQVGEHQDRPFAMCEADGKLLFGTIPDYYELGGALCLYDPETGEKKVWRNLIKNQSVTGVCFLNGVAYVSTGVWGGLSSTPTESEAKIFSFDLSKGKIIKEASLKFPFFNGKILHIGGLLTDSEGGIWGITSGVVFKLNPETLETEAYINVSGINWDINETTWKPFSLVELENHIYCNPDGNLVKINMDNLEAKNYNTKAFMLTKGKDNKIYFCEGNGLYRCR